MPKKSNRFRSMLFGALAFGIGFVISVLLHTLVFSSSGLDRFLDLFIAGRLSLSFIVILLITGLAGAVGGAIGGLALAYACQSEDKVGYAWRTALSFGIGHALIIVPFTLLISVTAFYQLEELSPIRLMVPLGVMGAAFGVVSGLILGLLTVGQRFWRVALSALFSFAFGGAMLGYLLAGYIVLSQTSTANWVLFAGVFAFGAIGGGVLGNLYNKLTHVETKPSIFKRFGVWYNKQGTVKRIVAVAGLILLALALRAIWLISPFSAYSAPLSPQMESRTIGTHWAVPTHLADNAAQPAVFATDVVAVVWLEADDIYFQIGDASPVNVSNSAGSSTAPQLVLDSDGTAHLVWLESNKILYSQCNNSDCSSPIAMSNVSGLSCGSDTADENGQPALAINDNDDVMVVWQNSQQKLLYNSWPADKTPAPTSTGCIPIEGQQPRLAADDDTFNLVLSDQQNIYLTEYNNENWSSPKTIGVGVSPEIFINTNGQKQIAWCNPGEGLGYWDSEGQTSKIVFPRCVGRPGLAASGDGSPRIVWFSDEVENVNGNVTPNMLIYESAKTDTGWNEPEIVASSSSGATLGGVTQPALAADRNGSLHLTWADESKKLAYTTHTPYNCSDVELSAVGEAIYTAMREEEFRPATDPIPYCYNRYDTLLHAPNPIAAYTDQTPTPNGTFDRFAELAKTAEYEVVFATMWYDSFNKGENPGRVLGKAIAELYQKLEADPSLYPRGITVRLLLGNPPSFAFLPGLNNQTWSLISDLQAAGVPEMRNDELGWKLEVANFSGSWPHSHMKQMIVDGKTVQSVGYNMQYTHLPTDHPSGKGKGRVDLGLQVTGPAAQTSLRAFDDLWQASTQVHCDSFDPTSTFWMLSCQSQPTTDDHVPEVLKYYIPDGELENAFSNYRTEKFREADLAHSEALASAQETIDIIHINFSLELICALNIFIEACTYVDRIDYMDALMEAIEENDVKARILVSNVAWVGVENNIAIKAFEDELAARGLSDNVEIRYFEQDMHIKAALIDKDTLIVGNQNLHYSAWGSQGSLAEYILVTQSPAAAEDFQRFFDYYWGRATKRE